MTEEPMGDMDGRVLEEVFTAATLAPVPVTLTDASGTPEGAAGRLSSADAIQERLRKSGYVE